MARGFPWKQLDASMHEQHPLLGPRATVSNASRSLRPNEVLVCHSPDVSLKCPFFLLFRQIVAVRLLRRSWLADLLLIAILFA